MKKVQRENKWFGGETDSDERPVIHICCTPLVRSAMYCDTCGRVRPMSGTFGIYYGWTLTCLACGDSYTSEHVGRQPRPFARNWRDKAISRAKCNWTKATPLRAEIARQIAAASLLETVQGTQDVSS
jgi:hypothetical protein